MTLQMNLFFICYRNIVLKKKIHEFIQTCPISLDYYVYKDDDKTAFFKRWIKEISDGPHANVKHFDDMSLDQKWISDNRLFYLLYDKMTHPTYRDYFHLSFQTIKNLLEHCGDYSLVKRIYDINPEIFKQANRHFLYGRNIYQEDQAEDKRENYQYHEDEERSGGSIVDFAFQGGNVCIVEFLYGNGYRATNICVEYAGRCSSNGNGLECLKFVLQHPRMAFQWDRDQAIKSPIANGNVEMVEFLNSHFNQLVKLNDSAVLEAFKHNRVPMMQFIIKHYRSSLINVNRPLYMAAKNGNIEIVKALMDITKKHIVSVQLVYFAASSGNVELVKYILEKKPYIATKIINHKILNFPASNGHEPIIRYLVENVLKNSAPDFRIAINYAIKNKHLSILKYLFSKYPSHLSIPYPFDTLLSAMYTGDFELVRYLHENLVGMPKDIQSSNSYAFKRALILKYTIPEILALMDLFNIDNRYYDIIDIICQTPGKLALLTMLIRERSFRFTTRALTFSIYYNHLDYASLLIEHHSILETIDTTFLIRDLKSLQFVHQNLVIRSTKIKFPTSWDQKESYMFKIVVGKTNQETIDICRFCIEHKLDYSPYPFLQHFIKTNNIEMVQLLANNSSGLVNITAQRYLKSKNITTAQTKPCNLLSKLEESPNSLYFLNFLRISNLIMPGDIKEFPVSSSFASISFLRYLYYNFGQQVVNDSNKSTLLTQLVNKANFIDPAREFCFLYYHVKAPFTSDTLAALLKGSITQINPYKKDTYIDTAFYRNIYWANSGTNNESLHFLFKIIEKNLCNLTIPTVSSDVVFYFMTKNFELGLKLLECIKETPRSMSMIFNQYNYIMLWKYVWPYVSVPEYNSKAYSKYTFVQDTLMPLLETKKFFSQQKAAKCRKCNQFVEKFTSPPCGCRKLFYNLLLEYLIADLIYSIVDNFQLNTPDDKDIDDLFNTETKTLILGPNISVSVFPDEVNSSEHYKNYNLLFNNHLNKSSYLIIPIFVQTERMIDDTWFSHHIPTQHYNDLSISKICYTNLDPLQDNIKVRVKNSNANYYRISFLLQDLALKMSDLLTFCFSDFYEQYLINK